MAWELADGAFAYALEGAMFVTGAAVQWLRDGLGCIERRGRGRGARRVGRSTPRASTSCPRSPASGSPWWDPYARGTIVGITRGTGRAHLARAALEAMAFQTRDVVEAMSAASGRPLTALRADGGASANDLLLQLQADQLQVPVHRPVVQETTALGAAYLAGLAEGVWSSLDEVAAKWQLDVEVQPQASAGAATQKHAMWRRAVERSRHWAER